MIDPKTDWWTLQRRTAGTSQAAMAKQLTGRSRATTATQAYVSRVESGHEFPGAELELRWDKLIAATEVDDDVVDRGDLLYLPAHVAESGEVSVFADQVDADEGHVRAFGVGEANREILQAQMAVIRMAARTRVTEANLVLARVTAVPAYECALPDARRIDDVDMGVALPSLLKYIAESVLEELLDHQR
jgi:hypothetical protein